MGAGDFTSLVLSPHWIWIATVALGGLVLMAAGFAGVYTRLWEQAGWVGFLGFVFLELAYLLQACKVTWEIFLYPLIACHPGAAPLLRDGIIRKSELVRMFSLGATATIFAGILFFCFALIRSREFPKTGGILLLVGALLYGVHLSTGSAIIGILILSIGCLFLGLRLTKPASEVTA